MALKALKQKKQAVQPITDWKTQQFITTKLTPEQIAERVASSEAYEREAKKLEALKLKWFAKLDRQDLTTILALADLLAYGEHRECMESAENFAGTIVFSILREVVCAGPAGVNNDPRTVKDAFDGAVTDLRDGLELRRKLARLPDSVLDYINSAEWEQNHACM